MRLFTAVLLTALLSAHPALTDITGPAIVTDGDIEEDCSSRVPIYPGEENGGAQYLRGPRVQYR